MNGKCGALHTNSSQLRCDYRRGGYFVKSFGISSSFSNTSADLKVPINPCVNPLNNVKVTVFWQAYYLLVSCSSSLCPPQSFMEQQRLQGNRTLYLFLPRRINQHNY